MKSKVNSKFNSRFKKIIIIKMRSRLLTMLFLLKLSTSKLVLLNRYWLWSTILSKRMYWLKNWKVHCRQVRIIGMTHPHQVLTLIIPDYLAMNSKLHILNVMKINLVKTLP
jgi:hypothetical protein